MANISDSDEPSLEKFYQGHQSCVNAITFSAQNGRQLASCDDAGTVKVWNFRPQTRSYTYNGHTASAHCVRFSHCNKVLASSSSDCTVRFWTPVMRGDVSVFRAHTAPVRCVDFTADFDHFATCADDKSMKVYCFDYTSAHVSIWRVSNHRFLFSFTGHHNWVRCCRFFGDGKTIASCSDDRSLRVWSMLDRSVVAVLDDADSALHSLSIRTGDNYVAAGAVDGSARIYDMRMKRLVQLYKEHTGPVRSVCFHPNGQALISASDDGTVKIYNVVASQIMYTLHGHKNRVTALDCTSEGDYVASADCTGQIFLWRMNMPTQNGLSRAALPVSAESGAGSSQSGSLPAERRPLTRAVELPSRRGRLSSTDTSPPRQLTSTQIRQRPRSLSAANLRPAASTSPKFMNGNAKPQSRELPHDPSVRRIPIELEPTTTTALPLTVKSFPIEGDQIEQHPQSVRSSESSLPESLTRFMDEIVAQLEMLTQTVTILERRLTWTEGKVKELLDART